MSKTEKNWKDFLLSSGIPLEYSIAQVLRQKDFLIFPEYNYIRKNEFGESTNFSIDLHTVAHKRESNCPKLNLNFLIECKYRYPNTKWIFVPDRHIRGNSYCFINDVYNSEYRFNYDYAERFLEPYSQVYKGIEILDDKFNPKSITQALYQLAYGYINLITEQFEEEQILFLEHVVHCYIPIIITTSELWVLKKDTSIEDIQKCNNIKEVAIKENSLIFNYTPDKMLRNYTNLKFKELNSDVMQVMEKIYTSNFPNDSLSEHLEMVCECTPGAFLIINYHSFKKEINKIIKPFYSSKAFEKIIDKG